MEFKGRVCVTGASGFLASWLVKRLLQSNYYVVGTVRDPSNENKLAHLWKLDGAKERLKLVRAELTEEGSFNEAVAGCDGVFHTASPVFGSVSDPMANMVEPAVNGTLNVLRSCKRSPSLRRVVLTSSSSAVRARDDIDPDVPLDESSWSSVELCQRFQIWYALSKTLAERAAWEFCTQNNIDLVTVLPSFVVGPSLPPELCSTASDVLGLLKGETHRFEWQGRMGYVHIDDVASCHILVFEHEDAGGRFLCSADVVENNELAALLSKWYPTLPIPNRPPQALMMLHLLSPSTYGLYMVMFMDKNVGNNSSNSRLICKGGGGDQSAIAACVAVLSLLIIKSPTSKKRMEKSRRGEVGEKLTVLNVC
uniref:NAD-dependent epimerase/dehydratase domain-containing protein n=1 Tax=Kalanchoe fedtschenkoi TaxID=63787 RepID=A0A7N0T1Z0_KALFE